MLPLLHFFFFKFQGLIYSFLISHFHFFFFLPSPLASIHAVPSASFVNGLSRRANTRERGVHGVRGVINGGDSPGQQLR